jgi:hypothetical protein
METITDTSPEMKAQIATLEAELGAPIDAMPIEPSDLHFERWRGETDRYDRLIVDIPSWGLGPWGLWIGGVIAAMGVIVVVMTELPDEGVAIDWGSSPMTWGVIGMVVGMCLIFGSRFGRDTHIRFTIDPRDRTITHTRPMATTGKTALGNTIPFDRIAAIQMCGLLTIRALITQVNLVMADPPGERVRLATLISQPERLTDIADNLAAATGKPLIVNDFVRLSDPSHMAYFGGGVGAMQAVAGGRPYTPIRKKKTPKKNDFLNAFDDELGDDRKSDA